MPRSRFKVTVNNFFTGWTLSVIDIRHSCVISGRFRSFSHVVFGPRNTTLEEPINLESI